MKIIIMIVALIVGFFLPISIINAIKADEEKSKEYTYLSGFLSLLLVLYFTAFLNH